MAGYYAPEAIDEILARVDLAGLVARYVKLTRRGNSMVGLCPFHQERTPSFHVTPDKQVFYCFGCGAGGNAITFLMKKEGLDFREAVEVLAERVGVKLKPSATAGGGSQRERWLAVNREALAQFRRNLAGPGAAEARRYLLQRGLEEEYWQRFELGWATPGWDELARALQKKGVTLDELKALGLVSHGQSRWYDRFRARVLFPISNSKGECLGFGGRLVAAGRPKYLNSPETPLFQKGTVLYALNWALPAIREAGWVMVVEGYLDALSAHVRGLGNVVASLGTALTERQALLLKRYCDEVVIAYDGDAAGQAATLKGLRVLQRAGLRVRVLTLPANLDPDEFLRREGAAALREMAEAAPGLLEYRLRQVKQEHDLVGISNRTRAARELLPDLAGIKSPLERGASLRLVASELGLAADELAAELEAQEQRRPMQKNGIGGGKMSHNSGETGAIALHKRQLAAHCQAERALLKWMLADQRLWRVIEDELGLTSFEDPLVQAAAAVLVAAGQPLSSPEILGRISDESLRSGVAELLLEEELPPSRQAVQDCLGWVKVRRLQQRVREVETSLRQAEAAGDQEQARRLGQEVMVLQRTREAVKGGRPFSISIHSR